MDERSTLRTIRRRLRPNKKTGDMPRPIRRTVGSRRDLASFFGKIGFRVGVEIGTHKGKYAEQLCYYNPKLKLYCVDPWVVYRGMASSGQEQQNAVYLQAVNRLEKYNVEIIKKTSMDTLVDFNDNSLDFVYIDGDHRYKYVYEDICEWSKKVKPGGIVACHDFYCVYCPGVTRAVEKYVNENNISIWFATLDRLATAFWVKP
jgi:hypothetical protein